MKLEASFSSIETLDTPNTREEDRRWEGRRRSPGVIGGVFDLEEVLISDTPRIELLRSSGKGRGRTALALLGESIKTVARFDCGLLNTSSDSSSASKETLDVLVLLRGDSTAAMIGRDKARCVVSKVRDGLEGVCGDQPS